MIKVMSFLLVALFLMGSGNETGNGGHGLAAAFIKHAYVILSLQKTSLDNQLLDSEQLETFEKLIRETRIVVVEDDIEDNNGVSVEARYLPDSLRPGKFVIELKEEPWQGYLNRSGLQTYRFVFHEYLNIIGIDDGNYQVSSRLRFAEYGSEAQEVRTCGLTGTITERITDCSRPVEEGGFGEKATQIFPTDKEPDLFADFDDPHYFTWRLVTRTASRAQFWRDEQTGYVWSDRTPMTFGGIRFASEYCRNQVTKQFRPDHGETFLIGMQHQWEKAIDHQMRRALPNMKEKFWVFRFDQHSSIFFGHIDRPYPFYGSSAFPSDELFNGEFHGGEYDLHTFGRCIHTGSDAYERLMDIKD